ncbi:MAG: excinuclease ABC subunit UvrA, partial [Lentisphaeria bacterium]|nr:excinuclease ABC subunit UvrA [Lentisphaeria bacterium]
LYILDEPTTGLHFHDIAKLLEALRALLAQGHSVVIIEHNLDVIRAADWLVDLGPEGGDGGGRVVCAGTPDEILGHAGSHTGQALARYEAERAAPGMAMVAESAAQWRTGSEGAPPAAVFIHNAREHNLKGIDVRIPHDCFTVITGVSGSGKSTVAFDILFAEGQRRYLESLNAYARQFVQPSTRPDVDEVRGVPPTVAIEQRTSRGGRKSTVGTVTEIHHFLRLLFVKLGVQHCPDCDVPIEHQPCEAIVGTLRQVYRSERITLLAPLVRARKGLYKDLAAWTGKKDFSRLRVDGEMTPVDPWPRLDRYREHDIELPVGVIDVSSGTVEDLSRLVAETLGYGEGVLQALDGSGQVRIFSTTRSCPECARSFRELDPRLFSYNSKHGWCTRCFGTGVLLEGFDEEQTGEERAWRKSDGLEVACPDCGGQRLCAEALAVRYRDQSIADFAGLDVAAADDVFAALSFGESEGRIARDIVQEIRSRLGFLREVGLPYLTLDRAAPTLSGGEAQRIRLAAQLGSNLRGVCYVLDEPTIGLHTRDNRMLLNTLRKIEAKGNTVVVVEHDEAAIREAEHIIDLGPGAGVTGGQVVAAGTLAELMAHEDSVTGRCLREPLAHPLQPRRRVVMGGRAPTTRLTIQRARLHNLQGIDVRIPLSRFVCVTGVSGSGKSTLVREVLLRSLGSEIAARRLRRRTATSFGCSGVDGTASIDRVLEVDQTPIGKTPRSCPATYVGFWDDVRRLFANMPEARLRGYAPGRFSFNVKGGRCDACDGQGARRIEMSFLPDVHVPCDTCGGHRFNPETLEVRFRGKSIADILEMSVEEAIPFFGNHPKILRPLKLLQDTGLGYLTLGQRSPTLSGGEAQRVKLVTELCRAHLDMPVDESAPRRIHGKHTLYLLDEPTIGLHIADVEKLLRVLHRLVDAGHTLVVIEHNLDVIAEADWVIDLGPEGGDGGGRVVAQGTPERVAHAKRPSHTGRALADFL